VRPISPTIFIFVVAAASSVGDAPAQETVSLPEVVCGSDIVTVGDAWDYIKVERSEIAALLQHGDLVKWPQRIAALTAHLRFIDRKATFIFGKARTQLHDAVATVAAEQLPTARLALAGDAAALREQWRDIEASVRLVEKQLPDEALISTTSLAHLLPPSFPILGAKFGSRPELRPGEPATFTFRLVAYPEKNIGPAELVESHGAKLHALIADQTLGDYHHEHPQPTATPGEWTLTFTPRRSGHYRVWLNAVPLESGREEFPYANLVVAEGYLQVPEAARIESLTAEADGLRGVLTFAAPLRTDELTAAKLTLTTPDGQPVRGLEPYMEAFAHLVGIAENYANVLHIHPHGATPKADERGGPDIDFRLRPQTSGFHKLFLQVRLDGRVRTLAFGIRVAPQS